MVPSGFTLPCGIIDAMTATLEKERTESEKLQDYRVERFEDLRFTAKEAEVLADAVEFVDVKSKTRRGDERIQQVGIPLHATRVRRMLENGCTHKQALRIFAPLVIEPVEDKGD